MLHLCPCLSQSFSCPLTWCVKVPIERLMNQARGFSFTFIDPDKNSSLQATMMTQRDYCTATAFMLDVEESVKPPVLSALYDIPTKCFNQYFSPWRYHANLVRFSIAISFHLIWMCLAVSFERLNSLVRSFHLLCEKGSVASWYNLILVVFILTCTRIRSWFQGALEY